MKKYNSVITIAAILFIWAVVGVAAPAWREVYGGPKSLARNNQRPEMRRQVRQIGTPMATMTLNNLLAMSYLQNIAIYARMLRDQVERRGSVDGDFARDVVAEIWRNFDRLDCYRREQMDLTQGEMRAAAMMDHSSMEANAPSEYLALREIGAERGPLTPPSPADQGNRTMDVSHRMEACLTRLSAHLIELERETGAVCPNPKWVLEHTNAILRLIDEIATTRGGSQAAR